MSEIKEMTFAEAFTDFSKKPENRDVFFSICKALGIPYNTYRRWVEIKYTSLPWGANKVKIAASLMTMDYRITDFTKDPVLLRAMIFIAKGKISFDELRKIFKYAKPSYVYSIFYGVNAPEEFRVEKLAEFLNEKFGEHGVTENSDHEKRVEPQKKVVRHEIPTGEKPKGGSLTIKKSVLLGISANQVRALLFQVRSVKDIVALIESDDFTDAERTELRALVGEKQFFQLTNEMYALQRTLSSLSSRLQREDNHSGK